MTKSELKEIIYECLQESGVIEESIFNRNKKVLYHADSQKRDWGI